VTGSRVQFTDPPLCGNATIWSRLRSTASAAVKIVPPGGVVDNEGGVRFFDGPQRREATGGHHYLPGQTVAPCAAKRRGQN